MISCIQKKQFNNMNIVQVIPQLREGGAERFVIDLCNALIEIPDCQVTLIVFFNYNREHVLVKELNPSVKIIELNKKLGFDFSIPRKLAALIGNLKPNVVHTHLNAFEYMFINIFRNTNKIKFINTIHNSPNHIYHNRIVKLINSKLFSYSCVTPVIISSDSIPEFQKLFPKKKPVLIFNGRPKINQSKNFESVSKEIISYKLSLKTKVFINVARISREKNQLMLVDAFNQLISEKEDVILLIIGTQWDKEITRQIKDKINSRIFLLGYKENPADYLRASDAFCLSSLHEGMPISLIEAIQHGVIPICTPVGGVKDIINPSIGFISKDFSTFAYIESLKAYLSLKKEKCEEMSSNGKNEYTKKYTMGITALKYFDLYISTGK